MDFIEFIDKTELDLYHQHQEQMQKEKLENDEKRHNQIVAFIRNLYQLSDFPYETYSTITFANATAIFVAGQNITDISIFNKKYFPYLQKLDLSNNRITVLENFDNDNIEILNLCNNPLELIKESFNVGCIKHNKLIYYDCQNVSVFFDNLKTYIKWLSNTQAYDEIEIKSTDVQSDCNLYQYIRPSLFELSCNKMQKKKFKKQHSSDYHDFLGMINKSLYKRHDYLTDHCDMCDKINVLYPRFLGGDVIIYKGKIFDNVLKKVVISDICYECYNKEQKEMKMKIHEETAN
jgi:hypothetical protein